MKWINLFFGSIIFCSCSATKQDSKQDTTQSDTVAVPVSLPVGVGDTVSVSLASDSFASLDDFPKEWVRVREENGKFVVHNYCDMGNPTISISAAPDSGYQILHNLGQMAEVHRITSFKQVSNSKFEIRGTGMMGESPILYVVNFVDGDLGQADWYSTPNEMEEAHEPVIYVQKENVGNYEVVEDDCENFMP